METEAVPQYAPADPTLPPPWRALVDGTTGYIYYWNTETNTTQYEKPMPANQSQAPQVPPQAPFPGPNGSAQVSQSEPRSGSTGSVHGNMPHFGGAHVMNSHGNAPPGGGGGSGHMVNNSIATPQGGGQMMNQGGHVMNGGPLHTGRTPSNAYPSPNPIHANGGGGPIRGGNINAYGDKGMPPHGGNMNENSFGGNGMPPHGGIREAGRGYPGANVGGNLPNGVSVNLPMQPKLAVLPQRQQVSGGMPVLSQPGRQMNSSDLGSSAPAHSVSYKRPAIEFNSNDSDPIKRQRMQGLPEHAPNLDVDVYRRQHEITVVGENVPAPFITFNAANFPPELTRELLSAGFAHPTPIQAQSWPLALQGRDIVAVAKTGSGKTLGYLLPAFLHLSRQRANSQFGPIVLVLAPTRELATQIQDEAIKFGRSSRISCTCVYGGAPKGPQLRDLDRGADIVIATPGRLNDFLEMKKVSLRQISYLVLDEADRMLDMGFEPQIRKIVKEIPSRRQTLMFTATWPKEVRKISAELLCNPIQVNIGNTDQLEANKSITQLVEVVPPFEKQRRLEQILRSQEAGAKIIIFCSTKKMCDQLARTLARGFGAAAIHGDKSQPERDHVLAQFKAGRTPILVATDVAARGLDVKDIRVVINFDFPTGVEDYVHRIGRTGRAGATGIAITFFGDQDSKYAKELIGVLEGANQKVPMELRDLASKPFYPKSRGGRWENAGGGGGRDGGYGSFGGGRGSGSGSGGRGGDGRGDSGGYGGRGAWGPPSHYERRERPVERYDNKDRFSDKNVSRDRYMDERSRGRDTSRRFGSKDRGRSYSRSYSRSRSRSRGRSGSHSWSRSRSRSRSDSYDRCSDDYNRRSPYRERGSRKSKLSRSKSPRSPASNRSPNKHRKAFDAKDSKFSAIPEDRYLPDMNPSTDFEDKSIPVTIPDAQNDLNQGDVVKA